ncbi:hypothetical protein TRFO_26674 [Tritrichomonas foetus]|uniref:Trafficking protein particle complex subunit 11 C-terminal domain-containing protein n=1 Tax=Tritrichomonas foetus TaxID=1144522 RepID=A0A1J4K268_9EUKA|nr:hypothetical protein TRFO_26674 [Tritrichomonas foetus]|eukprot:OHT05537.1 hypothetical protein TRFO_26674 [Tritrichomonas foetus]
MTRAHVLQLFDKCKELIQEEKYDDAYKYLIKCINRVLKFNYYPMLDLILKEHLTVIQKLGYVFEIYTVYFIRLSPQVRSSNSAEIFSELKNILEENEVSKYTLGDTLKNLFPLKFEVKYIDDKITSREVPKITVFITSYMPEEITINDVTLVLMHNKNNYESQNNEVEEKEKLEKERKINIANILNNLEKYYDNVELLNILETVTLETRRTQRFTLERNLPPAISSESVIAVIFNLNHLKVHLPINISTINVTPDESACKLDIIAPKRCVIGSKLPLKIVLTASEQKIEHLSICMTTENSSIPFTIDGTCRNVSIKGETLIHLPNINPFENLTLNINLFTMTPIYNPITFKYRFGTELSGIGELTKIIPLNFIAPFDTIFKLYDENFIETPPTVTPTLARGRFLTYEVSITNNLNTKIDILNIQSPNILTIPDTNTTSNSLLLNNNNDDTIDNNSDHNHDVDNRVNDKAFPISIDEKETYVFMGSIVKPGSFNINIEYEADGIKKSNFTIKTPSILNSTANVSFQVISPPSAVVNREFTATIIIECLNKENCPSVIPVVMEILQSSTFFIFANMNRHTIYLFKGQRKEIPIKFVPLEAGSTFLPQITLVDETIKNANEKIFQIPIVVSFQ